MGQIISRRKAKTKLPSWYGDDHIIYAPPLSLEQCSSEQTAKYKTSIVEGERLIDLTGGLGIDCLALYSNFKETIYVEHDPFIASVFQYNCRILNKNIEVYNQTAESLFQSLPTKNKTTFYIDPDRREGTKKVFRFEDCSPNILEILTKIQSQENDVLIKASPLIDLSLGITQLKNVQSVFILSIKNEVKEVLFYLSSESSSNPEIVCEDIGTGLKLVFTIDEEKTADVKYGTLGKFLYDPMSVVTKAGAYKLISQKYGLGKLAPNSHFYTSNEVIDDFPGRIFQVMNDAPHKKEISGTGIFNIITRNYPLSTDGLKKKYRLREGGDLFLVGFRDQNGKSRLVICRKVK